MLRIDPAQRHRLEEIRDNLIARIAEAEREGWTGEAEGLRVSLAANNKIAQADATIARQAEAVTLGIPTYHDIATTLAAPGDPHGRHRLGRRDRSPGQRRPPCSGGERRILLLSASLAAGTPVSLRDAVTVLDDRNIALLLTAIRHATGKRPAGNG